MSRAKDDVGAIGRRAVLRAGAAGSFAVVMLPLAACGGQGGASMPSGPLAGGNVSSLEIDTLTVLENKGLVLGRDAGGVYAMSAVCTHASCIVSAKGDAASGLECHCHGSEFDALGNVTRGPARSNLIHYAVAIAADGTITVDADTVVDASVRTMLPSG